MLVPIPRIRAEIIDSYDDDGSENVLVREYDFTLYGADQMIRDLISAKAMKARIEITPNPITHGHV